MDITFLILTWNSSDHLSECLVSLFENLDPDRLSFEIRIVDNGSVDATKSIITRYQKEYPGKIFPIWMSFNSGTTFSRNLALKLARGDFIVVLDSDVEIRKGTVETLMRILREDPSSGMAVPRLEYPDGRLQKSTDAFPTILTKMFRFFFLKYKENLENRRKQQPISVGIREVDYAISAFWVVTKKCIETVGLLDENIFYAPEDVDFCLRMWKSGHRVLYVPQVSAIHHAREISRGIGFNRATFHHLNGLIYFFKKHRYFLKRPRFGKSRLS